jgi:oligopeptide transport system permease protein
VVLVFAVRRIAQMVVAIVVATFIVHVALFELGDPFATSGEKLVRLDVQAILRAKFGMDQPFFIRYLIFLRNLATGDLGIDFDQRRQVWDLLASVAPNTFRLALVTMVIGLLVGLTAGTIAATTRYPFLDALITVSTVLMICLPTFVVAVVLRAGLSGFDVFGLEVFPTLPHKFGVEVPWFKELLLPAFTLAVADAAFIARLTRASMLDVLASDYLRTARSKGLPRRTVIGRHALRNALIPVVNLAGINFGVLLGGTVLTEAVFQYDGVGYLFYRALRSNNNPVIMAVAVYAVLVFLTVSVLADLACAYLDPRIRVD